MASDSIELRRQRKWAATQFIATDGISHLLSILHQYASGGAVGGSPTTVARHDVFMRAQLRCISCILSILTFFLVGEPQLRHLDPQNIQELASSSSGDFVLYSFKNELDVMPPFVPKAASDAKPGKDSKKGGNSKKGEVAPAHAPAAIAANAPEVAFEDLGTFETFRL